MTPELLLPLAAGAALVALCALLLRWTVIIAKPDEWLLLIRDGRMIRAGVGIHLLRRPGDVVARFSSTLQRVRFEVEALTSDRQPVLLEGFILWAVAPAGEAPFLSFSRLGIVNLADPRSAGHERKHLLTGPQHRAFKQLLAAAAQRHAARYRLDELLLTQDPCVAGLRERFEATTREMGVAIHDVQVLGARPLAAELLDQLGAPSAEAAREEAAKVHLSTQERIDRREIESATALEREKLDARRDTEVHQARAALDLEQERAELLERQAEARRQQIDHERELELLRLEQQHETEAATQRLEHERAIAREQAREELAALQRARAATELDARLEARRREAEAERDATLAISSAEERKSQAVRDHELSRLGTEKMAEALSALPLKDARWVSVGEDSPLSAIGGLLLAAGDAWRGRGAKDGARVEPR